MCMCVCAPVLCFCRSRRPTDCINRFCPVLFISLIVFVPSVFLHLSTAIHAQCVCLRKWVMKNIFSFVLSLKLSDLSGDSDNEPQPKGVHVSPVLPSESIKNNFCPFNLWFVCNCWNCRSVYSGAVAVTPQHTQVDYACSFSISFCACWSIDLIDGNQLHQSWNKEKIHSHKIDATKSARNFSAIDCVCIAHFWLEGYSNVRSRSCLHLIFFVLRISYAFSFSFVCCLFLNIAHSHEALIYIVSV